MNKVDREYKKRNVFSIDKAFKRMSTQIKTPWKTPSHI